MKIHLYTPAAAIEDGSSRVVSLFLVFPRCVDGELRWLERAHILQTYEAPTGWADVSWHTAPQPLP